MEGCEVPRERPSRVYPWAFRGPCVGHRLLTTMVILPCQHPHGRIVPTLGILYLGIGSLQMGVLGTVRHLQQLLAVSDDQFATTASGESEMGLGDIHELPRRAR